MKKLLVLLLSLVMVFSFAACGGSASSDNTSNTDSSASSEPQEYTAYTYEGEPKDALTVEEVILMPQHWDDYGDWCGFTMKVRNTSGADIPMNESAMRVWYCFQDERGDTVYENYGSAGYSSTIEEGQGEWIEETGIPTDLTETQKSSITTLKIYGFTIGLGGHPDTEFTEPVVINIHDFY